MPFCRWPAKYPLPKENPEQSEGELLHIEITDMMSLRKDSRRMGDWLIDSDNFASLTGYIQFARSAAQV